MLQVMGPDDNSWRLVNEGEGCMRQMLDAIYSDAKALGVLARGATLNVAENIPLGSDDEEIRIWRFRLP